MGQIAKRDTGQSRRVANFLLAWHNAEENGGWDPTDLWGVDTAIAEDMLADFDTPLTKDDLVKRRWALAMLSVHSVRDAYRKAYERCKMNGTAS